MNQGCSRMRQQALIQGENPQNAPSTNKRLGSQRNIKTDRIRDDVFFDNRLLERNGRDSCGFQFTRDQKKRMQYKNRISEANSIRLFVYNVPKRFSVDDIYGHIRYLGIDVKDLWQSSHRDARRKSFVVKIPRDKARFFSEDETIERLNIRVREYKERSD